MAIASLDSIQVAQRRVLVRLDLDAPLDDEGNVLDDARIRAALPTIKHLRERRAKLLIATQITAAPGKPPASVLPVAARLAELLDDEVLVPDECVGDGVRSLSVGLRDGQIIVLENLFGQRGEEAGSESFARDLAGLVTAYVNDAFSVMHRPWASVSVLPGLLEVRALGLAARKEVDALQRLHGGYRRPFVAVLGGAAVGARLAAIVSLLPRVQGLVLGGGLGSLFLAAMGRGVGGTPVDKKRLEEARVILRMAREREIEVHLPVDHVVAPVEDAGAGGDIVDAGRVSDAAQIVDIGPSTAGRFADAIAEARTLYWSGPMGVYEVPALRVGTERVAQAVAQVSGYSVVSGDDSVQAVHLSGVTPFISHLSAGGDATLAYVEGKELPGLMALES